MPIVQLPIRVEGRNGSAGKAGLAANSGESVTFVALTLESGIRTYLLDFSSGALVVQVQSGVNQKMHLDIEAPSGKTSFVAKVTLWPESIITLMPATGSAIREKSGGDSKTFYVQVPLVPGDEAMLLPTPPSV